MSSKERMREYRKELKQRAFELIGSECVFCGVKDGLHAAHVQPTKLNGAGRGMDRRYLDVIKNPQAYRPMCGKHCHKIYDKLVSLIRKEDVEEEPIPY